MIRYLTELFRINNFHSFFDPDNLFIRKRRSVMKLMKKVAVVTGASRGIGKCIAVSLAQEGVSLALLARDEKELAATAFACEQYGVTAKVYPIDLSHIEDIEKIILKIKNDFKEVNILVNDAGKYADGDPFDSNLKEWDYALDLNFRAPYHLTNNLLKIFNLNEESAVINISSISGLTITEGGEIYNASKAALKSYGGCLFESVREKGIKVTNIYPGYVNTNMTAGGKLNHDKMIQPQDIASAVVWALSMPSNACPTDITIRPQFSPSKTA
jgi:NADP-dependent 3-hydroxy acid dehydrogenase YdfG